jgi:hypothetical protein
MRELAQGLRLAVATVVLLVALACASTSGDVAGEPGSPATARDGLKGNVAMKLSRADCDVWSRGAKSPRREPWFDCAGNTAAAMMWIIRKRGWHLVKSRGRTLRRKATGVIRAGGTQLRHLRRASRSLPRRLSPRNPGHRWGTTERAARRLHRWLHDHFRARRVTRRLREMAWGCGIGALTMFVIDNARHGESREEAINGRGGAIDGCIVGALSKIRR